jgi:hypothetical protein
MTNLVPHPELFDFAVEGNQNANRIINLEIILASEECSMRR